MIEEEEPRRVRQDAYDGLSLFDRLIQKYLCVAGARATSGAGEDARVPAGLAAECRQLEDGAVEALEAGQRAIRRHPDTRAV